MTAGTRSSTRSKAIPRLAIEQAENFLQDLPKREKENLSVSEAITGMSETVRMALAKGYSYNEISDMLSDKLGVSVSAWSLRRYIPAGTGRGKRKATAEDAPKRGRKKKDSSIDLNGTALEAAEVPEEIEIPAAPAATRRRTTRSKAETVEAKPPATTRRTRSQPAAKKTSTTRSKSGTTGNSRKK